MAKRKKPRVPTAPKPAAKQPLLTGRRLLFVILGAATVAALLVGASLLGARGDDGDGGTDGAATVTGAADVEAMLDGIPQAGAELGEPDAPVTLVEYADLQCPFCAEWSRDTLPELVAEYVRDGRLRIEFRGLAFIGPESEAALRAALAAGEQEKLWNVVDLIYLNQGAENGGWVTEDFLRAVGDAVPGLDVDRMLEARDSAEVSAAIEQAAADAEADGVSGTPFFLVGETGGELAPLEVESLGPDEFRAAIDDLLG